MEAETGPFSPLAPHMATYEANPNGEHSEILLQVGHNSLKESSIVRQGGREAFAPVFCAHLSKNWYFKSMKIWKSLE